MSRPRIGFESRVVQPPDLKPFDHLAYAITSSVNSYCSPNVGVKTLKSCFCSSAGKYRNGWSASGKPSACWQVDSGGMLGSKYGCAGPSGGVCSR